VPKPWALPEQPAVVITGASSGIGEACAYRFARAGSRLALLARREDRLQRVAEHARTPGAEAHVIPVDLASATAATEAIQEAEASLGAIDVLALVMPFLAYALLYAARRNVEKDIKLVESMDRLR